MKKPNSYLLRLYEIGRIRGIEILQKQTSSDSADTFCVISNGKFTIKGKWSTYSGFINVQPFSDGIAKLLPEYEKQVEDWIKFETENDIELKEYERLKAKYG